MSINDFILLKKKMADWFISIPNMCNLLIIDLIKKAGDFRRTAWNLSMKILKDVCDILAVMLVVSLLTKKEQSTYEKLFEHIIRECLLDLLFLSEEITVDFELQYTIQIVVREEMLLKLRVAVSTEW